MKSSVSFTFCIIFILAFVLTINLNAQTQRTLILANSGKTIRDYTLEIPVEKLNLSVGEYRALVNNSITPVEIITDLKGHQKALIPISEIKSGEKLTILIEQGTSETYPKRTHAELTHKIGGHFEGNKYVGEFSWVGVNRITLPGTFRDHSYYLKFEGPGWESDRVAYRYYLDNRNAIDVFAKTTSDIVLPSVGVDGYDNYHKLASWGMDNLKVGKSLGLGTIALWNGEHAQRLENRDSTTCTIQSDGKLRSQVKTIYHGLDVDGQKCNIVSLISIDAGSNASHMEIKTDKTLDNIATGIIKLKQGELKVGKPDEKWTYIATFDKQSLNNDMQGLAILFKNKQLKTITEDSLNYVIVLNPENNYTEYYFMATWELEENQVKTEDEFIERVQSELSKLNNHLKVTIKH